MPGGVPGGPVVRTTLPLHGTQVRSLVGELKFHMPYGTAKKKKSTQPLVGVSAFPVLHEFPGLARCPAGTRPKKMSI